MLVKILLFLFLISSNSFAYSQEQIETLKIDKSRERNLASWKIEIKKYTKRHYNLDTYNLKPYVIVLHYTVSQTFPWNLVNSNSFGNETPGLASHYVVDENKIWQILPTNIISRGAYGINHKAINIEMVALNENDLFKRKKTLSNTIKLLRYLQKKYSIDSKKIYSHQDVSKMNKKITPEIKDLVDSRPYGKIDPGNKNMEYIKNNLKV